MVRRLLVFATLCALTACLWRSYATILSVHLDVLTQTADKLCDVVESGRGPNAQAMAEYVYPAQRGREFLRQFESYHERSSYRQFGDFLDRYEALIQRVDGVRAAAGDWNATLPELRAQRDALRRLATAIRSDAATGK